MKFLKNKNYYIIVHTNQNHLSFYTINDSCIFTSNITKAHIYTRIEDAKYDCYMIKRIGNYDVVVQKITKKELYGN